MPKINKRKQKKEIKRERGANKKRYPYYKNGKCDPGKGASIIRNCSAPKKAVNPNSYKSCIVYDMFKSDRDPMDVIRSFRG